LKKQLRAHRGIGWNKAIGGTAKKPSINSTKVRKLWNNGLGASEIATLLNTTRTSIYRVLSRYKGQIRRWRNWTQPPE
jgi:hypothetical protein